MSDRPTPIELLTSNTNEQKILATLGRIEALLLRHFDGDADRPGPVEPQPTALFSHLKKGKGKK